MSDDHFGLQRFVEAQDDGGTYARALGELREGRKRGHWIWFVFPQIAGLGSSPMSRVYAIGSLDEARVYLEHPILGPRLRECCEALLAAPPGASAESILGGIDALKLRSSMTLFASCSFWSPGDQKEQLERRADPAEPLFAAVLDRFYAGEADPETERRL